VVIGIGSKDRSSRLVEPRTLFPIDELLGIELPRPIDPEAVRATCALVQPAAAPLLEVPEPVHQALAPEVDLERGGVMRRRPRGVILAAAVQVPQLCQLFQELIDRRCIATTMLRV